MKTILERHSVWGTVFRKRPCPSWLSWLIRWDNPFCKVHHAGHILDSAEIQEGMCVLDAGCGPGRVTKPLAWRVGQKGRVVALDAQEKMLVKAHESMGELPQVEFRQGVLGEGKLEKSFFDHIFLVTVLGETDDPKAVLRELFEALKPGGRLCITEIIFDPNFCRRKRVRELALRTGFTEIKRYGNCWAFTLLFEKKVEDAGFGI